MVKRYSVRKDVKSLLGAIDDNTEMDYALREPIVRVRFIADEIEDLQNSLEKTKKVI